MLAHGLDVVFEETFPLNSQHGNQCLAGYAFEGGVVKGLVFYNGLLFIVEEFGDVHTLRVGDLLAVRGNSIGHGADGHDESGATSG
jgi:hypothetical protein